MRYRCHQGYTLSGVDTLTCRLGSQLQFEGTVPTCEGTCPSTLPGPAEVPASPPSGPRPTAIQSPARGNVSPLPRS